MHRHEDIVTQDKNADYKTDYKFEDKSEDKSEGKSGKKPKVAIIVTGGTILCDYDPLTNKIKPVKTGAELLAELPALKNRYEVDLIEFSNMPGPHLTPQIGLNLADTIEATIKRRDISGVVVLQGTDTLEEMSYLCYLLVDAKKPVVFTGSMKSSRELYVDSMGNLYGATCLAASEEGANRGVMVYFNQNILSPRYVVKTKASNVDSFQAPETGPIGVVNNDNIRFFNPTAVTMPKNYRPQNLTSNVQLIKVSCGNDDMLLHSCVENKVDGIVIEGYGTGNIPPNLIPALKKAVDRGIPVVVVSQCIEGFANHAYDYVGGGAQLKEIGVICGQNLGGLRARLKLIVLHSVNKDMDYIRQGFSED